MTSNEQYIEFMRSGPLKRVYVDIPVEAHESLRTLARSNGLPMKAQLTLLILEATSAKPKRTVKKKSTARSKKRGTTKKRK